MKKLLALAVILGTIASAISAEKSDKKPADKPKAEAKKEPNSSTVLVKPEIVEKLKLSPEQKQQIDPILKSFEDRAKEIQSKATDEAGKKEAVDQMLKLRTEMEDKFSGALTDQQRKDFEELQSAVNPAVPAPRPGDGKTGKGKGEPIKEVIPGKKNKKK